VSEVGSARTFDGGSSSWSVCKLSSTCSRRCFGAVPRAAGHTPRSARVSPRSARVSRPRRTPDRARRGSPDPAARPTEGLPLPSPTSPHNRRQDHVIGRRLRQPEPMTRRREPPVFRPHDQALATRVCVQVVELGLPEALGFDLHRMARRLPQAAFAILTGSLLKDRCERGRETCRAKSPSCRPVNLRKSVRTFSSALA
jgi:hypothetical protein